MGKHTSKVTAATLLIAFGIIFGDIGTSPLYVLKAIVGDKIISEELIIGALSCIIWTLTLQTTTEYVILVLRADNKGEGGIFSLYTLIRRQKKWFVFPAMLGGAALLADGMITPPISVTSAVEGLRTIPGLEHTSQQTIIIIVISILALLFFFQQFGTASIGKIFGPVMLVWFTMLAILGGMHLADDWTILKAFNPYYAIQLITRYPEGFWLLGAVFLCTTGAEALYSDLGHCGRANIRYSWIFVKTCLLLNYLGQGAWILANYKGQLINHTFVAASKFHPFYGVMPEWFRIPGTLIATCAAIIASQALISGSFTLIGEAMRLNLWPKMKIKFPTEEKGQIFIAGINTTLFIGCTFMVFFFQNSDNMEAAYGLTITACMTCTTILFANYLVSKRVHTFFIYSYLTIFITIQLSFLTANLNKFLHGGYITFVIGGILFCIMYIYYRSRKIKNRYVEFVRLENYLSQMQELSNDRTVPKYATHLIYLTSANNNKEIEHKIVYSILNNKPKRADIYWFVHVDTLDDPYTCEYVVEHIIPNDVIRIEFQLGFRVEQKIDLMFRKVVEDLVKNREVNITSRYESLEKNKVVGDFQFVVMEKYLSNDNELPFFEQLVMRLHLWIKDVSLGEERGFGLNPSFVTVEKFPLLVSQTPNIQLKRKYMEEEM